MGSRQDSYYDIFLFQGMTVDLKAYNLLDAYVQYAPKKSIKLFVDFKNLLDTDYVDFTGYTTKGLNLNAGFLFSIK